MELVLEASPGVLPDEAYDLALVWWRASIRRLLMKGLKTESRWLAAMQARVRTDWLDAYFVYTSSLGTHTFFMTLLPAVFFFGHAKTGRGLVTVLGMGVYWSSFIKDLVCSPRPFSPPVTRLTMGNHHLEYGFPSTHSTNCTSIALYIHTIIYRMYLSGTISSTTLYFLQAAFAWYFFSIVYGRLYCGMHSIRDCVAGVSIGAALWAPYWVLEDAIEDWLSAAGWSVPVTLIPLVILMINQHPQPVDDCPCFEDSIAFVSSILGVFLGQWHAARFGFIVRNSVSLWDDWTMTSVFGGLKLFFGVLSIFVWRLVAKAVFHAILPPTFRFAAHIFTLPNRRFYTPATDYEHVPTELGLHPIPSVIDLPNSNSPLVSQASASLPRFNKRLKLRNANNGGPKDPELPEKGFTNVTTENPDSGVSSQRESKRKHYDADVLTKVMVYVGIGMIAAEWGPVVFALLGW
ncbi:hypothetical protein K439DRAFT_1357631 [Ramaria rubella]|nr:hypothetical protein K439DRAFT_1357631 [Ramaria rubella]